MEFNVFEYFKGYQRTTRGPMTPEERGSSRHANLNLNSFSSPTEAKYAKMSPREEVAKEQELQKVYERIWLPPPVKHNPWED
jgi:hypothetical protein